MKNGHTTKKQRYFEILMTGHPANTIFFAEWPLKDFTILYNEFDKRICKAFKVFTFLNSLSERGDLKY